MNRPRLLNRRGKIGLGVAISVIASVVMAILGTAQAYAVPNQEVIAAVPPQLACDLKITKTMSPTPLKSTQPATVTLTVANVGTGLCLGQLLSPLFPGGTSLSDTKPAGLTFTSPPVATPAAGWTCGLSSGNAFCFNPTTLPPGYTATFTIPATVTAAAGTTVTNCAQISNPFDTNTANNQSCVTNQVVTGPTPPTCDLKITKTMSPTPLKSTQPATVTLIVANVGAAPCVTQSLPSLSPLVPLVVGPFLFDTKPAGLTFTSPPVATPAAGWSCFLSGGNVSCSSQTALPPGYTATFTITATVTAAPGTTVTNCAQVGNLTGTNTSFKQSCVTSPVV